MDFMGELMKLEERAVKAGMSNEDILGEYEMRMDALREDIANAEED